MKALLCCLFVPLAFLVACTDSPTPPSSQGDAATSIPGDVFTGDPLAGDLESGDSYVGDSRDGDSLSGDAVPTSCESDDECASEQWCRATQTGGKVCVPYAVEGEFCGGYTPEWGVSKCLASMTCTDGPSYIADVPGMCRVPCDRQACPDGRYCSAFNDVCRDTGACFDHLDCDDPDNGYLHVQCVGYGVCGASRCSWQCGNIQCRDLEGRSFGMCFEVLGWAIVNGSCQAISGCATDGYALFASADDCNSTCL